MSTLSPSAPGDVAARHRLLVGPATSFREHEALHGPLPSASRSSAPMLVNLIARSGLTGRGGGGFPVAAKISSLRRAPGAIVANASEGEPLSAKDSVLLQEAPHLVLDGLVLLADALAPRAALTVVVNPRSEEAVQAACAERPDHRRLQVRTAAPGFVSGEATAVASALAGGEQIPTDHRLRLTERGPHGSPVLVQNAETLAHIAVLVREGAEAFRAAGTDADPGTRLVTLARPEGADSVHEVPGGCAPREVLRRAGVGPDRIGAILVGGYHGRWVLPGKFDLPLGPRPSPSGLGAGAGVLMLLARGRCPLPVTTSILDVLAEESAGQCGPCVLGLPRIVQDMRSLAAGNGDPERLRRRLDAVVGRGACHHPDGTVRLAASALDAFWPEISAHAAGACMERRR